MCMRDSFFPVRSLRLVTFLKLTGKLAFFAGLERIEFILGHCLGLFLELCLLGGDLLFLLQFFFLPQLHQLLLLLLARWLLLGSLAALGLGH